MKNAVNKWAVFDGWGKPSSRQPSWSALDAMIAADKALTSKQISELSEIVKKWDDVLADFGWDPSRIDWRDFRPLRLTREEDWSDWLAYFIGSSKTGLFARRLFGDPAAEPGDFIPIKIRRELETEAHRADIVVEWGKGRYSHIEVKLWDKSFDKTFDTSSELEHANSDRAGYKNYSHYILLPGKAVDRWLDSAAAAESVLRVQHLTWEDLALAIRLALRNSEEGLRWRALAYNFAGAIEQHILGFPRVGMKSAISAAQKRIKMAELSDYLQKGLKNE